MRSRPLSRRGRVVIHTTPVWAVLAAALLWFFVGAPVEPQKAADNPPDPLAHWTMDAVIGGKVPDVTGNGHDAVLGEGVELEVVDGPCNKALKFNPAEEDYLTVSKSEDLQKLQTLTVMAWIKPMKRPGAHEILCGNGDKSGDPPWPGWRLRYFWARADLRFGTPDGDIPGISSPNHSIAPGYFHHVAATYDGQTARVYINCVQRAQQEIGKPIAPGNRTFIIGNYIGRKNAYPFDGAIDELKVYDEALTSDQIFAAATADMPER
ncbi:MAG: LamG domain-containing protein [Armatimonadota bacterium]